MSHVDLGCCCSRAHLRPVCVNSRRRPNVFLVCHPPALCVARRIRPDVRPRWFLNLFRTSIPRCLSSHQERPEDLRDGPPGEDFAHHQPECVIYVVVELHGRGRPPGEGIEYNGAQRLVHPVVQGSFGFCASSRPETQTKTNSSHKFVVYIEGGRGFEGHTPYYPCLLYTSDADDE